MPKITIKQASKVDYDHPYNCWRGACEYRILDYEYRKKVEDYHKVEIDYKDLKKGEILLLFRSPLGGRTKIIYDIVKNLDNACENFNKTENREKQEKEKLGKDIFTFDKLTVKDNSSGLVWTIDSNLAGKKVDWEEAKKFIAKINTEKYAGYNDWRLPSQKELKSLAISGKVIQKFYKEEKINLAFNRAGFRNAQSSYYWSSSTFAGDTDFAWVVSMDVGLVHSGYKSHNYYVWPVRSGRD